MNLVQVLGIILICVLNDLNANENRRWCYQCYNCDDAWGIEPTPCLGDRLSNTTCLKIIVALRDSTRLVARLCHPGHTWRMPKLINSNNSINYYDLEANLDLYQHTVPIPPPSRVITRVTSYHCLTHCCNKSKSISLSIIVTIIAIIITLFLF